jgi:hypothetical protein
MAKMRARIILTGKTANDSRRIAPLGKHTGQLPGHTDAPVRQDEKHDAPLDVSPPPSNAAVIFLRDTAGNENGRIEIV